MTGPKDDAETRPRPPLTLEVLADADADDAPVCDADGCRIPEEGRALDSSSGVPSQHLEPQPQEGMQR